MSTTLILAPERRRRVFTALILILAALVYFYEYPLYGLLYLYSSYHELSGMEGPPAFQAMDYGFVSASAAILLFVYLRPRSYIRSDSTGQRFDVSVKGRPAGTVSLDDLRKLEFKSYAEREGRSRSRSWRSCVKIHCLKKPEVVFYDAVMSLNWRREKRLARRLEEQLGPIEWKDKDGILTGRADPEREKRLERREKQWEKAAARTRSRPPAVVKAYGARFFFALVFAGFGAAFWHAGYVIPAWVFLGLSGLLAVDLALTWLGFGQKPAGKGKSPKS